MKISVLSKNLISPRAHNCAHGILLKTATRVHPSYPVTLSVVQSWEEHFISSSVPQSQPLNEWTVKYSTRKKGLPLDVIALFGRQVLEVSL